MIRGHKIRLNPTPEQETSFRKASGVARFVYNWGLAQWKAHKAEHPGKPYGTRVPRNAFKQIKGTAFPFVSEVAKDVAENAFANLGAALKNYFESKNGKRKGSQMGFPQFKTKKKSKRKFCLNNDKIAVDTHAVKIPWLVWVNMAENLRWDGYILRAVVSEDAGKQCVALSTQHAR